MVQRKQYHICRMKNREAEKEDEQEENLKYLQSAKQKSCMSGYKSIKSFL